MVLQLGLTLHAQIQAQSIFYNFLTQERVQKIYFESYVVRASFYTVVRLAAIIN